MSQIPRLPSPLPAISAGLGAGCLVFFIGISVSLLSLALCENRRSPEPLSASQSARGVPQWTPDGNHIVFEGNLWKKSSGIYIVRSDGSELKRISATSGDSEAESWPDISPDGSKLVVTTSRHKTKGRRNFEIETSNLNGSDRRRLTENGARDRRPAWSPDGGRIGFSSHDDDGYHNIIVMSADGSDKTTVFDARSFDPSTFDLEEGAVVSGTLNVEAGPEWSPDGEMLAFISGVDLKPRRDVKTVDTGRLNALYTVRADGGELTPLVVAGSAHDAIPPTLTWSPDGSELAFLYYDRATEGWPLYTVGLDGSGLRNVLGNIMFPGEVGPTLIYNLSWSPKGDEIRFNFENSFRVGNNLVVAKADGSGYSMVGRGAYPAWSPDGSRIALRNPGGSSVYLATIAADGSDEQVLVLRYTDGSLRAARPGPKKCFLWACW